MTVLRHLDRVLLSRKLTWPTDVWLPEIETVNDPVAIVLGPTQPRPCLRSRLPSPPSNILFTHITIRPLFETQYHENLVLSRAPGVGGLTKISVEQV